MAEHPLARLRAITQARIGLGRAGQSLPTNALLEFELAHARARDAVHQALDAGAIARQLAPRATIEVRSRAGDRATYLQRPDLGRLLDEADASQLSRGPVDLAFVLADGLSASATQRHAVPLLQALLPRLEGWQVAPVVIAHQARVALGDEVGAALGAAIVVVLIGERPGLSAPDSLGAYITWAPRRSIADSSRNCVSNIRPPHGLAYADAAGKIAWLLVEARARRLTGVQLKDESPPAERLSSTTKLPLS